MRRDISPQTTYAGAGDLMRLHLPAHRVIGIPRSRHHRDGLYATDPDVDAQLHLAGAAGVYRQSRRGAAHAA